MPDQVCLTNMESMNSSDSDDSDNEIIQVAAVNEINDVIVDKSDNTDSSTVPDSIEHKEDNSSIEDNNSSKLLSVSEAFRITERVFKAGKVDIEVPKRLRMDRVPAKSSLTPEEMLLEMNAADIGNAALRTFGIPEPTWHVPLTIANIHTDKHKKTTKRVSGAELEGSCKEGVERKSQFIKNKERVKRMKGQSSQTSWKPELWMKMRQTYD